MKVTFTPGICLGVEAAYAGSVTLRVPSYDDRMSLYEGAGLDAGDDEAPESRIRKSSIPMMRHVAKLAPQFVEKIEITRKKDGFVFGTFEQLSYDTDGNKVITEIVTKLIGRHEIGGNDSSPV